MPVSLKRASIIIQIGMNHLTLITRYTHFKVGRALHHSVCLLKRQFRLRDPLEKHINPPVLKILCITIGNGPKEKTGKAIRREADKGTVDESLGILPTDAPESIHVELDLVGDTLGKMENINHVRL